MRKIKFEERLESLGLSECKAHHNLRCTDHAKSLNYKMSNADHVH